MQYVANKGLGRWGPNKTKTSPPSPSVAACPTSPTPLLTAHLATTTLALLFVRPSRTSTSQGL